MPQKKHGKYKAPKVKPAKRYSQPTTRLGVTNIPTQLMRAYNAYLALRGITMREDILNYIRNRIRGIAMPASPVNIPTEAENKNV